jgi:hypothetical protein
VKRTLIIMPALLILAGLLLAAGCAPPPAAQAALQATATPQAADPGDDTADPAPMMGMDTADDAPVDLPQTTGNQDTYCLDCHSDAEQLQLLAEEEEVAESLNEGSG